MLCDGDVDSLIPTNDSPTLQHLFNLPWMLCSLTTFTNDIITPYFINKVVCF